MDNDRNQNLRERAYRIWEDQGRPEGRHEDHWHEAERSFEGEVPEPSEKNPAAKAPRRSAGPKAANGAAETAPSPKPSRRRSAKAAED